MLTKVCDICGRPMGDAKRDFEPPLIYFKKETDICSECQKSFIRWADSRKDSGNKPCLDFAEGVRGGTDKIRIDTSIDDEFMNKIRKVKPRTIVISSGDEKKPIYHDDVVDALLHSLREAFADDEEK